MEGIYTIETRIRLNSEIREYLNSYVVDFSQLYRVMWSQMSSPDFKLKYTKPSYYISHICNSYGVLKRTANTIYRSVIGRQKALIELKKVELSNVSQKFNKCNTDVEKLKFKINSIKPFVAENKVSDIELIKYRLLKKKLYQKQRKCNRLKQRRDFLRGIIDNKKYSLCFGTKKIYKQQWCLKDNHFKTHKKWYNTFVNNRDKYIEYLGSSDETYGNQMCQLEYNEICDNFSLKLRKEKKYAANQKYLIIDSLDFKYMKSELINTYTAYKMKSLDKKPISYRFVRRNNKWYLQVILNIERTPTTRYDNGTIGLDFNNGFIEVTETDKAGNILNQYHFQLRYHGCGNKAKTEMAETVSAIVNIAVNTGKDISIENLNFNRKKATVGKNKCYNKMIHTLDYSRYTDMLKNACHRKQVGLIQVNSAYTSIVGGGKYGKLRKLNKHQAASYIIARLGQGFTDKYKEYQTIA